MWNTVDHERCHYQSVLVKTRGLLMPGSANSNPVKNRCSRKKQINGVWWQGSLYSNADSVPERWCFKTGDPSWQCCYTAYKAMRTLPSVRHTEILNIFRFLSLPPPPKQSLYPTWLMMSCLFSNAAFLGVCWYGIHLTVTEQTLSVTQLPTKRDQPAHEYGVGSALFTTMSTGSTGKRLRP